MKDNMLTILVVACFGLYGDNSYSPPTSYTASYGPYYAEIPVNDPMMRSDFDTSKETYPETYYNNPYQKAWERAQEVQEAQREAFWAE